jgi:hypothetical protein
MDGALQRPSALHAMRPAPPTSRPTWRHDLRVVPQMRSSAPNIATAHGAICSANAGPFDPHRCQTLCRVRCDAKLTSSVVISSYLPLGMISSCCQSWPKSRTGFTKATPITSTAPAAPGPFQRLEYLAKAPELWRLLSRELLCKEVTSDQRADNLIPTRPSRLIRYRPLTLSIAGANTFQQVDPIV